MPLAPGAAGLRAAAMLAVFVLVASMAVSASAADADSARRVALRGVPPARALCGTVMGSCARECAFLTMMIQ
jgi:hypothetical protein